MKWNGFTSVSIGSDKKDLKIDQYFGIQVDTC